MKDFTDCLPVNSAHDMLQFLFQKEPDILVDWGWVYHCLAEPLLAKKDCASGCAFVQIEGKAVGECCGIDVTSIGHRVELVDEIEASFLSKHCDDKTGLLIRNFYDVDDCMWLCAPHKCNRYARPFWCRSYPFLPVVDRAGKVYGVYTYRTGENDPTSCPVQWDEVTPAWKEQFVQAWEHVLQSVSGRNFVQIFLLDVLDEKVYRIPNYSEAE